MTAVSQRSLRGLDDSSVTEVVVWSFDPQDDHQSYVTEASELKVRWSGFQDPHSGLTYFRVALGSAPALDDVVPFLHVGLQTCEWTHCPPPLPPCSRHLLKSTCSCQDSAGYGSYLPMQSLA